MVRLSTFDRKRLGDNMRSKLKRHDFRFKKATFTVGDIVGKGLSISPKKAVIQAKEDAIRSGASADAEGVLTLNGKVI